MTMAGAGTRTVDPRLRVIYLAAVAVGAFLVKDARIAAALVLAHAAAWLALGLGLRPLTRQVLKLWGFAAFITASYAVTAEDPSVDRWVHLDLGFSIVGGDTHTVLPINIGGAATGGLMILRVLVVVLASRIARAGDERAIASGLRKLGTPEIIATSIDAVLALLGGGGGRGGGRGGGGGGGGGRGRGRTRHEGDADGVREGFLASLRRIARGDVGPIIDRMERHIGRAEDYLEHAHDEAAVAPPGGDARARITTDRRRDITVIVGLSLTMLGIKALKLLPNIPFAPGHKLVLLTPLYVVAALKTRTRIGATLTGLVMGSVAFLLGDGRYGIFEILKHVIPGILCDLLVPLVVRAGHRPSVGALVWSIVGGIMGLGRFATIFAVTLTVQAPAVAWAFLVPGLVIHTTFGILSGLVSSPLIRAVLDRSAPSVPNVATREARAQEDREVRNHASTEATSLDNMGDATAKPDLETQIT